MTCPRCQQENPTVAHFCMRCGTRLTLICAKCNIELPTGAAFCLSCGHPVATGSAGQRFAAPVTYTPKHLAETIVKSKAAPEGEPKQVTERSADLKGSMQRLADRDPGEEGSIRDPGPERRRGAGP